VSPEQQLVAVHDAPAAPHEPVAVQVPLTQVDPVQQSAVVSQAFPFG
jgi:hypothetical protein